MVGVFTSQKCTHSTDQFKSRMSTFSSTPLSSDFSGINTGVVSVEFFGKSFLRYRFISRMLN